jgi:hypothetical protein
MRQQQKESIARQATERMATWRDNLAGHIDSEAVQERGQHALEQVEHVPTIVYLLGVFGSIALSTALFIRGRRAWALFVGLWPPTIIGLAQATKQLHPARDLHTAKKAA